MKHVYIQLNKGGIVEIHSEWWASGQFSSLSLLINDKNNVAMVELDTTEISKLVLVLQKILLDSIS